MERAQLEDHGEAAAAAAAVTLIMRRRIAADEVDDVPAQLPSEIRVVLEGRSTPHLRVRASPGNARSWMRAALLISAAVKRQEFT
jgi:uncharacterized protein (DUF2267 family)